MAERLEEAAAGADDEYTQDGTVDLHGNPVLRSKRGGWKACGFVVGTDRMIEAALLATMNPSLTTCVCHTAIHGLCFRARELAFLLYHCLGQLHIVFSMHVWRNFVIGFVGNKRTLFYPRLVESRVWVNKFK